ncbi:MAG: PAS domain S-box protein [Caulobacteraceae bacterium]
MNADPPSAPKSQNWGWSMFGAPHAEGETLAAQVWANPTRDARFWLTALAAAIAAGALAGSLIWQSQQAQVRERTANGWYAHTMDVLIEVGRFSIALGDTQRGVRGYILTGDRQSLAPYESGRRAVQDRLRRLQALTADNPGQERRLAELATDVAGFLAMSQRLVQLEGAGRHEEALAIVRGGAPNAEMERAGALSAAISAEEQRLLAERRKASLQAIDDAARMTFALAILGTTLLVMAAGLAWLAIAAAMRARMAILSAQANERLAATGALLSLFVEEAPAAIAMFDLDMRYLAVSRRYAVDYGLPRNMELVGRSHYDVFPEIPQRWRDIHARALAGETIGCDEDPFPRADGHVDWVRWRLAPWRTPDGKIGGALLFSEVITAQVEALNARRSAEARLHAIFETAADAIVVIDERGIVQSANPATTAIFGYAADELVGRDVNMLMPEPARSAHGSFIRSYLDTGDRKVIGIGREVEGLRRDGSRLAIDLSIAEWSDNGRRFFTGLMRDISVRKIAEAQRQQAERRELVVGELRHRINNMFSVINALISATARSREDVRSYRDALLTRVSAFAASQVELARVAWTSRAIRELINFELKAYIEADTEVSLEGPDLLLNGSAAESLAMMIHELATNAAKYGALSRPGATLHVRWGLAGDQVGEERVVITWVEHGGPAVAPPERRGFGSTVIERSAQALGGTARLEFAPEGLRCTIETKASMTLQPDAAVIAEHPGADEASC